MENNNNNIPLNENQQLAFTTLNENIIPDKKFLNDIDEYQCKLSEEIVRLIANESGLNSIDNRVYKLISISSQQFIEDIISSTAQSIISKKNNNKFYENKELLEVLKEKGISNNKSQFYCDNININMDNYKK